MRPPGRPNCPSTRVVACSSSTRFRCFIPRPKPSRKCSMAGVTSNCAATSLTTPSTSASAWFAASLPTPTSSHGPGPPQPSLRSSSPIYVASKAAHNRRPAVIRTAYGCSARTSPTRTTAGIESANSVSARTRLRCSSRGTPQSTFRTMSRIRQSGRSQSRSCRTSSITPTTKCP